MVDTELVEWSAGQRICTTPKTIQKFMRLKSLNSWWWRKTTEMHLYSISLVQKLDTFPAQWIVWSCLIRLHAWNSTVGVVTVKCKIPYLYVDRAFWILTSQYQPNETVQPLYFQNWIIMFCFPIPTLIYLWEIYIFPGSVSLFCCSQKCGLILRWDENI